MAQKKQNLLILILIGLFGLWWVVRYAPLIRYFLLILIAIAIGLFLWYILSEIFKQRAYEKSAPGQIEKRIRYCQVQVSKNQKERQEAQTQIDELTKEINNSATTSVQKKELERLIEGFGKEVKLRDAKIAFFESALLKLKKITHQHKLAQSLEEKKEKLRKMRENHFDDLAGMEELRTEVESDVLVLETIESLSERMFQSADLHQAETLLAELEKMTREID